MAASSENNQSETSQREYEKSRFEVPHHILRSEVVYGDGFQSPGGLTAFQQTIIPELRPWSGIRVLDIGSGLGGAAFYLAADHGAKVVGIDLAETMISIAESRRARLDPCGNTQFIHGDIYSHTLEAASFDAIYTQDTLMYEAYKPKVLARCRELLKPGGVLVVNDFCYGRSTKEFENYLDISGLHLISISSYEEVLRGAGFETVRAQDISKTTAHRLQRDMSTFLTGAKQNADISEEDVHHLVERWHRKIDFLEAGVLTQGLFRATVPDSP
ncbi:cyclopropane-fatty-acyl-phospholipid synthase [Basidiobolus meristosporus CBS 931.73]|uniref:phosphoethanolamine N-methyltransferase n=1 Tax=Basidiobolus meristosporus CBS 931.73 TaxID=1314790 RepID=A0A1Y1X4D0_9FUNG|nr:cyclopropane-fatty-acyl-phospholipid synthase [Basidiobolus meristosporus CBS 931.73]|eukprot:ORX80498.1 cyclopropane-fatty-acyl-phospholipid synthase [Basidiobolus meristosporus CBS 931.73]